MWTAFLHSNHLRYLMIASICVVLNNVILIVGDRLGRGYVELVGLTFLVTGSMAYLLHSGFTFRCGRSWIQYGQFMAGIALGTLVALALLAGLCEILYLPMWIAAPTATVLMFIYNYLSTKLVITLRPLEKLLHERPNDE